MMLCFMGLEGVEVGGWGESDGGWPAIPISVSNILMDFALIDLTILLIEKLWMQISSADVPTVKLWPYKAPFASVNCEYVVY
jgi:hypothetical protein